MSRIAVDVDACTVGWGPCDDGGLWGAHECKRRDGHEGRHVCVCGSWTPPVRLARTPRDRVSEDSEEEKVSDRLPHDPLTNEAPRHCPECDEPWPCAERKRQREEKRWVQDLLASDLYERVPLLDSDEDGIRYRSPLGWSVWFTYGHQGLPMTIRNPVGKLFASTTHGTREWLDEVLP